MQVRECIHLDRYDRGMALPFFVRSRGLLHRGPRQVAEVDGSGVELDVGHRGLAVGLSCPGLQMAFDIDFLAFDQLAATLGESAPDHDREITRRPLLAGLPGRQTVDREAQVAHRLVTDRADDRVGGETAIDRAFGERTHGMYLQHVSGE